MSFIELKSVGKTYGKVEIFRDLDLSVDEGEFIVLVGPSGCGKSTLLRMIAGLEDISSGDLFIAGQRVNNIPAKKRDIAMVFQSYALYPHMTVAQNMSFALRLARVPKEEQARRVEVAADILGLTKHVDRLPRELSGGQRQRVAMGRAIVRDPKAFLFDEPLSNLDAKLRHGMRGEIRRLHQRLGRTTVYVTHDQVEAMSMADRIVVLNDGRIEQVGSPRALYDDPDNLFVAGFIGTPEINLFEGRADENTIQLDNKLRLDLTKPEGVSNGTRVICGIRPQHLSLAREGLPGEVVLVEQTGEGQELLVRIEGDQEITVMTSDAEMMAQGERVHLSPMPGKAFLFEAGTGRRLRAAERTVELEDAAC